MSTWQPGPMGPARRLYTLTPLGMERLRQWAELLEQRGQAMVQFAQQCRSLIQQASGSLKTEQEQT